MQCIEAVFMGLEAALVAPNTHIVDALSTVSSLGHQTSLSLLD